MAYYKPRKKATLEGVAVKDIKKPDGPHTNAAYKYKVRAEAASRMGGKSK